MTANYQCVIFDLDGTLLDTSTGILAATEHIVQAFALPPLTDAEKRSFIGPPIQKSFQRRYHCDEGRAWQLADAWRNIYKEKYLLQAVPYDGVYEALRVLRGEGIKTCVATNKREDYTVRLLDHFEFLPLMDVVCGTDFAGTLRKADLIQRCVQHCEVPLHNCLMIGDTENDQQGASEAGIDFLGVTYGFGYTHGSLEDAYPLVDNCKGWAQYVLNAGKVRTE